MNGVLEPAGPQAARIASLWWLTTGVCAAVFAAVFLAYLWAVWRAPRGDVDTPPDLGRDDRRHRHLVRNVGAAVAVSSVLLVGLLVASVAADRALAQLSNRDALHVRITAHQWWWQVAYDDPRPERMFTTANELRIPVGRPVIVSLDAEDVIHSLWIPALHGKKDLIPGRPTTIRFRADEAGEYRGRCAEFCGLQHAFMELDVIALESDRYEAWAQTQRQPAADPSDTVAQRGRELFLGGSCMLCHAIQGTSANARKAPDLTHVASRAHLGAGRLPNTPTELKAWIADPQRKKPGANMPAHPLPDEDLDALVAYLGTLK
jgi:cytochrome c oxidase subunit 2